MTAISAKALGIPKYFLFAAPELQSSYRQPFHSVPDTLEFCLIVNFIFSQRTPLSHSTSPENTVSGEAAQSFCVGNK